MVVAVIADGNEEAPAGAAEEAPSQSSDDAMTVAALRDELRAAHERIKQAEAEAVKARTEREEILAESVHLRWTVKQAKEALADSAAEAAALVAERDEALSQVNVLRTSEQSTFNALSATRKVNFELEATLLAERTEMSTRIAEAEHTGRQGRDALEKMRFMEAELAAQQAARATERRGLEKRQLMASRLLELEGAFGPILTLPVSSVRREAAVLKEHLQQPTHLPPPAERSLSPQQQQRYHDGSHPCAPRSSLSTAISLPLLPTTGGAQARTHVARGAARVAARRGMSLGSRTNSMQALLRVQQQQPRSLAAASSRERLPVA